MEAVGILPKFRGTAIHDAFASYFGYGCAHGLCNAHLLRDLTFLREQNKCPWAEEFITLLLRAKEAVAVAKTRDRDVLDATVLRRFEEQYQALLDEGLRQNPPRLPSGKRGRTKQSSARNLLMRLQRYRHAVLGFMYDFGIPFDNNQAERDIRMAKVRQKISGCFRSDDYARIFCRTRGYISTLRKQGIAVLPALRSVFMGQPVMPALTAV